MADSSEERLDQVEMALMLFMAILTGEPADATREEKEMAQTQLAGLLNKIRARHRPV